MQTWGRTALVLLIVSVIAWVSHRDNPLLAGATLTLLVIIAVDALYWVIDTRAVSAEQRVTTPLLPFDGIFGGEFNVVNHTRLPLIQARIISETTLPGLPGGYEKSLAPREAWQEPLLGRDGQPLHCQEWGRWRVGPTRLEVVGPLHVFGRAHQIGTAHDVTVLPRWVPLARSSVLADAGLRGDTRGRWRNETPPTVRGAREYREGDHRSSISALLWARTGEPMVRLYEYESRPPCWVLLDLDDVTPGSQEYKLAVTAAASVGYYATVKNGLMTGCAATGLAPLMPDRGPGQFDDLLMHLLDARPVAHNLLRGQMPVLMPMMTGSPVIFVITTRPQTEWDFWQARMQAAGMITQPIVISTSAPAWTHAMWLHPGLYDLAREGELIAALEGGEVTTLTLNERKA